MMSFLKFEIERSKVKVMTSGGSRAEFGGHVEREAYNGGLGQSTHQRGPGAEFVVMGSVCPGAAQRF